MSKFREDYTRSTRNRQNVYALIGNSELYITPDEYKLLASKKEAVNKPEKTPFYKTGHVLSQQESVDLHEPLVAALDDGGGYVDKLLWQACPQLDDRPIWSDMTPLECTAIAKLLLKRGQVDPAAATVVRAIVDSADYATVIMAIGPRLITTGKALRDRPRVERKKKFSIVRMPEGESSAN